METIIAFFENTDPVLGALYATIFTWGLTAFGASFVFFFSLGYGARLLAPIMSSAKAWRIMDVGISVVMWLLAYMLLFG